ncbi:hypothetical protein FA95DRAFT_1566448 [Auriscalpium vulgare]|uniref:Uncharacterized protein n=1 Tax=Auriscalpium vulgare TaxID=40419 RepID=A0ACB8R8L5_9AGAM|nr:hypothetical protein FA95DRAFT_1566448 [Auriscalpium vulgare]
MASIIPWGLHSTHDRSPRARHEARRPTLMRAYIVAAGALPSAYLVSTTLIQPPDTTPRHVPAHTACAHDPSRIHAISGHAFAHPRVAAADPWRHQLISFENVRHP